MGSAHNLRSLRGQSGDEHRLLPCLFHGRHNAHHLLRGLPGPVNHLRHPLAQPPVVVHLGVTQVLKWLQLQLQQGIVHRNLSLL